MDAPSGVRNLIVEDLLPEIRRVVARFVPAGEVADVAQECCVRLIDREALYDPERGSRKSWVARVAQNLSLDHLNRRRRKFTEPLGEALSAPAKRTFSEDQVRWVLEQLRSLSEEERQLVRLRYLEERTTTEIGDQLKISQSAAFRKLEAVIDRLRRRARTQGFWARFLPVSIAGALAGVTKMKVAVAAVVIGVGSFFAADFFTPTEDIATVATIGALEKTRFVLGWDEPIAPGENVIWSSSSSLAWQELSKALGGEVKLSPSVGSAEALERTAFDRKNLAPKSFVAGAGRLSEGIVDRLQAQVVETFGRGRDPELDRASSSLPAGAILTYAFVARDLRFRYAFDQLDDRPLTFQSANGNGSGGLPVKSFGIAKFNGGDRRHLELTKQVEVRHYAAPDEFILKFLGNAESPEVVIARRSNIENLRQAMEWVRNKSRQPPLSNVHDSETLQVPVLDFHLGHQFTEFAESRVQNAGFEGQPLSLMQTVRFRLDERGAVFRGRTMGALSADMNPRRFVVDGPFLLLLQERDARDPMLAIWVANEALLVGTKKGH